MPLIRNVKRITPDEAVALVSIELADNGMIARLHPADADPAGHPTLLDGGGELLAFPGFIDIHAHGANGADVSNASPEAIRTIAEAKLKEGVTTWLPTTWTETPEALLAMARAVAAYRAEDEPYARTPFLHVEGPFLNPDMAGAQDPAHIRPPAVDELRRIAAVCPVGLVSLAIELPGAMEFIRAMAAMGVACSAAHSAATHAEFLAARQAGLAHLTHFCNQMSPLHHREVGLVGSGFLDDQVGIELIADTIHLAPDMLRLVFKHRLTRQLMLVTDSMAAAHLGDGTYPLGATTITVKDGAARIPAGNLAGSVLKFNDGLRHVAALSELPLPELARTTAANQARNLGLDDRGQLQPGQLADIALLTPDFQVAAVIKAGQRLL